MLSVTAFATAMLALPLSARVIWIPAEFDPEGGPSLMPRGTSSDSNLVSCGSAFPSDFSCSSTSNCLQLSTNASITAVLCCPSASTCSVINPVNCDQSLQNATTAADSQLHSDPTTSLETCGDACCPIGASCQNGFCHMNYATSSSASSSTSSATSISTQIGVPHTTSSAANGATSTADTTPTATADNSTVSGGVIQENGSQFSGASFAAGFVPGIVIGAIMVACLLLLCLRRRRNSTSEPYFNEKKNDTRDTLTDLGTLSRRPTMHGRSISEPTIDPSVGHRTDFLRNTPPRVMEPSHPNHGYTVEVSVAGSGPTTPRRTPKAVKALFSHSPFLNQTPSTPPPTQPPIPAHLKRGTLSFNMGKPAPIRALRKQKSAHSLRRQMTSTSRGSSRRARPDTSRSGSTETILVRMPDIEPYTPDQRPPLKAEPPATLNSSVYRPTNSSSSWGTSVASPLRPADQAQHAMSFRYPTQTLTPTPAGRSHPGDDLEDRSLGTPYTPSKYYDHGNGRVTDVVVGPEIGLQVIRKPEKRDTTFSAMMERAGLTKSQLIMGTDSK